jgi:hypothetical protein
MSTNRKHTTYKQSDVSSKPNTGVSGGCLLFALAAIGLMILAMAH